jgi:hypothetical protein
MKSLAFAAVAATFIVGASFSTGASALPAMTSPGMSAANGDVVQVRHRRHHRGMRMRMGGSNKMIRDSERKENGMSSGGTRPPNMSR